ncbi:universal stress protein [Paraflavitalea soli]|uniref:Universal stress protein n=1 Tax=Paraflavitalea soli TaxID=2315862 RepID=A0A3B7MLK7_9BACT|nr:universal stress protein [Paraflavitalea soli]AXY74183.1 universal stress protein [Paraflavitalea soli]
MKNILMATDFSQAASNAAAYGVELAKTMNARPILFSACEHALVPASEIAVVIRREELQDQVQQQLAEDARMLAAIHDQPVFTCCHTGPAHTALLAAIREQQADILIAGMKNKRKVKHRLIGSTVSSWIGKLPIPMIIVPENIPFAYIAKIALAQAINKNNTAEADEHVLIALRELGERFHAQLYFVRIGANNLPGADELIRPPASLASLLETPAPHFEYITGTDVAASLTQYIEDNNINLLAIMPHRHGWFERMFIQSTTRSMVLDCPVPLLILPPSQSSPAHRHATNMVQEQLENSIA